MSRSFSLPGSSFALLLLMILGSVATILWWRRPPAHWACLESSRQFRSFCQAKGLYTHTGTHGASYHPSYFVSDHPLSIADVAGLSRVNCGKMPRWKGIVWVTECEANGTTLAVRTVGGHVRVWGNLVLAGDPALLDRLEKWITQG